MDVPARIEVDGRARVELTWEDGRVDRFTAAELRAACPCAACREPDGRERTRLIVAGPVPVEIDDARLLGDYAVGFVFSPDGHRTGIFSFEYLQSLRDPIA